jgi:hypothetical protein
MVGRSTRSLGIMRIAYAWSCKYCEAENAAGTEVCVRCGQSAIARAIDVDRAKGIAPPEPSPPRDRRDVPPGPLRVVVGTLLVVGIAGAIVERFSFTIAVELGAIAMAAVGLGGAWLITHIWGEPTNGESDAKNHDA